MDDYQLLSFGGIVYNQINCFLDALADVKRIVEEISMPDWVYILGLVLPLAELSAEYSFQ